MTHQTKKGREGRGLRYVHGLEMGCQTEVVSAGANENTSILKICEGLLYTWDSARARWGVYTVADGTDWIDG